MWIENAVKDTTELLTQG